MSPRDYEILREQQELIDEWDKVLKDFYDSWDKSFEHTRQTKADSSRRRVHRQSREGAV